MGNEEALATVLKLEEARGEVKEEVRGRGQQVTGGAFLAASAASRRGVQQRGVSGVSGVSGRPRSRVSSRPRMARLGTFETYLPWGTVEDGSRPVLSTAATAATAATGALHETVAMVVVVTQIHPLVG